MQSRASSSESDTGQTSSLFLTIAAELRQRIYQYTFEDQFITLSPPDARDHLNPENCFELKFPTCANILPVCHQTYAGALPIFYDTVQLWLDLAYDDDVLVALRGPFCGRFKKVGIFHPVNDFSQIRFCCPSQTPPSRDLRYGQGSAT